MYHIITFEGNIIIIINIIYYLRSYLASLIHSYVPSFASNETYERMYEGTIHI